MHQFYIIKRET